MLKQDIINEVKKAMSQIEVFHKSDCLNWKGMTSDTNEKISDVVAGEILMNLHRFNQIKPINKNSDYRHQNDQFVKIDIQSNDKYDFIKRLLNLKIEELGIIKDYEVAINDNPQDEFDVIDMVCYNKEESKLFVIQIPSFTTIKSTVLQILIECYTKYKMLNHTKFLNEYLNNHKFILAQQYLDIDINNIKIIPVIIFDDENEPEEMGLLEEEHKKLHALFLALDVKLFNYSFNVTNRLF